MPPTRVKARVNRGYASLCGQRQDRSHGHLRRRRLCGQCAINDRRIKALETVSAVNIGAMLRNGWEGKGSSRDAFPLLEAGSQARTTEANGSAQVREAWEYYRTPRCACSTAPSIAASRSLTQLVTYDAFNMADVFLTQPLQIVAGSAAGSKWMSDDLYARAASGDKNYHVVEGADHMSLYDVPEYVDETPSVLASFFKNHL